MKICFVNSYYPPWVGGAESYARNIARALSERGHEVCVYCSDRPLKHGQSFDENVRIIRMRTPVQFYGTPVTVFEPSFLTDDYDVIHANFPSPYLASVAAFSSRFRGRPSVLTWHNDLPAVTSLAGVLVKVHYSVSPAYLNFFNRIIATTNTYAKKSPILRRYPDKVRVVRNGVDTKRFNPAINGDSIRTQYGLIGKRVALFVAALTFLHSYKGVDVLINAFKSVSEKYGDARLLIVGSGNMLDEYRKMALGLGLVDRVIFAGYVSDALLPEYYAACDVVVLPSKDSSEGFGLVLLEAMATGKPVIGSRVGGIIDVVDEQVNGLLVEPNDSQALSKAIISAFDDPELGKRLGLAGRQFAETLDWSKVVEKVEAIYKGIS